MLSQDDQRRLGDIERSIWLTDAAFADGLRDGTPRRPTGDRRWPLVVSALAGLVMLLVGLAASSMFVAGLGGTGTAAAAIAYRRHLWNVQGRARRRSRRKRR
jgi:hypothetical protein